MAISRCDKPAILVYGGTIRSGKRRLDCPGMGKAGDSINISE